MVRSACFGGRGLILAYEISRAGFVTWKAICLCERHVEARKVLGWSIGPGKQSFSPVPSCHDCDEAKQPTVLDRAIEIDDNAEPAPVPVLPGQGKLFR